VEGGPVSARESGRQLGERHGSDPIVDDMQGQIDDLTDRLNNACVDRVELRAEVARLKALIGEEGQKGWDGVDRAEAIRQAEWNHDDLMKWVTRHDERRAERDEARSSAARFRLAWQSARRRAKARDESIAELMAEGEAMLARATQGWETAESLAARLGAALDELGTALDERDQARAEVVRLGRENELLATALREANGNRAVMIAQHRALISVVRDREAAAMAEGAPGFAAATERLRAALAEERIEPLGGEGGDRT
jgi:chromosome segregation ATPase